MERFFHIRPLEAGPKGGATVRVVGAIGDWVTVQYTICSEDDQFCRKVGREKAALKESLKISLSNLPLYLNRVAKRVVKRMGVPRSLRATNELWNRDYTFAMSYWTRRDRPEIATQQQTQGYTGGALMARVAGAARRRPEIQQGEQTEQLTQMG